MRCGGFGDFVDLIDFGDLFDGGWIGRVVKI